VRTSFSTNCVQHRFYDEVKDDAHGVFTPEMMKLPQVTWIETFVKGVTDNNTGLTIFKDLVWFTYKVSGVMSSESPYEDCWSIEGWIYLKRRNKLHQKLVEKLVHTHTNLVLKESLDDTLHHLLPEDISSMCPLMSPKRNPKFKRVLFLLISTSSVEGRDTCMDLENFYVTPCFSHDYNLS
jgi:hypothetical protein